MQILVHTSSPQWGAALCDALRADGFASFVLGGASPLPDRAVLEPVCAMIIDDSTAPEDCVGLCARIRNELQLDTPIIAIGAEDSLSRKLSVFAAGCDDYLVRPFHQDELLARLRSIWRRQQIASPPPAVLRVADLEHDPGTCETRRAGRDIKLGPISRKLLHLLLRESPRVVTRERLEFEIWGDAKPERDLLRSHISMLRKAVDEPHSVRLIQTVHGTGFRLVG
jgi:DNA-binding response OmpR family regulator